MIKGIKSAVGAYLLLSCLSAQPVMALSTKAVQALQQTEHSNTTEETLERAELLTDSSGLNDFLPELIGPHLYVHLLQSDQFITLLGLINALWEE